MSHPLVGTVGGSTGISRGLWTTLVSNSMSGNTVGSAEGVVGIGTD